jgi:hypothetical protein
MRNVRDAHQQADDLYGAIRQGESYEAVGDEYRQFDRAWRDAVDLARDNRNLSQRTWNRIQEVNQLDTRLHDILRVDSPLTGGKRTWVDRSRSLVMSAEDLVSYLRRRDLRRDRGRELRRQAEDVAIAARDFYEWFEAGNRDMSVARDRVNRISDEWRDLSEQLNRVPEGRNPRLFSLVHQVEQKLRRLEERFAN